MRRTFTNRNKLISFDNNVNNIQSKVVDSGMGIGNICVEIDSFFNKLTLKRMNKQFLYKILMIVIWTFPLFAGMNVVHAQDTLLVKGKIVNFLEEPVIGVSIGVEGSADLPVLSDSIGDFTVKITSGYSWLNIEPSSGYKKKRINLNKRTYLKIYLTRDELESGDDKISIFSNNLLKRNIAGSHSILNVKEIDEFSYMTIDQYMQGNIPGLHVVNRNGDPGSGAFTILHGINSLNASNEPLYIIDGIPESSFGVFQSNLDGFAYNPLLALNVQDISQVTFIKDPAITASYGSKASNGLVIINTLDPSATKTVIELDIRTGVSLKPSTEIPQLDASQHKSLVSEILFSSGKQEEVIQLQYPNLYLNPNSDRYIDYQHNTDWQEQIFDNAIFSNINLNVKGGDEIAKYGLSFGYMDSDGYIKSTSYNGYNLRFVSMANIFKWLKMNTGVSMSYNVSNLKESARVSQTSPIYTALAKSPMLNPYKYDEEGRELTELAPVDELGVSNPQAVIDKYHAQNSNFYFNSSLGADAQINSNLLLKTNFGLSYNIFKELIFMPKTGMELYYNEEAINVSKGGNNKLNTFFNNTSLLWNKKYGNHGLSSNTGINILTNNFEYDWALTKNASANDEYQMLQDGTSNLRELGGMNQSWNWLSIYENFNYSFQDRYLATASISFDGSSRVGNDAANTIKIGDNPFGIFYGGAIGWRLSSEEFMNSIGWLEELKLRLSYGKTGNDDIGESNANNYYQSQKYRQTVGLYKAVIPNSELTYETVNQLNLGLDISLWGDRLTANVDIYSSVTNDMLIYRPLEAYFGYAYRPENNGQMENKGIDVKVFYRLIDQPSFKWDVQGTFSKFGNVITEIEGNKLITEVPGAEIVNQLGETANSFYGYVYNGVYSTTEDARKSNLVNERNIPYQAGDAMFSDLSGPNGVPDGTINDYDKTVIGSSLPEFFGGLKNTFTYKRWSLITVLQYVSGNEIFNYVRSLNESMSGLENQSNKVLNRWQYQGQDTDVPRARWDDPVGNSSFSTRWIEDGSYLKIKNISLSYTVNDEFFAFKNAKFYVSANNMLTISKYLGYDPEFGYSRMQFDQGIDYGQTPQPRQFVLGVKLGF